MKEETIKKKKTPATLISIKILILSVYLIKSIYIIIESILAATVRLVT